MPRKRKYVADPERKRAVYSCDRCKKKKRGCKRLKDGVPQFDNVTPCEECVKSGSSCCTTIPRKKRSFYSVSESSRYQLKCLIRIVKAAFPENDPNNFHDIEKIANALYVSLPTGDDPEVSSSDEDEKEGKVLSLENGSSSEINKEKGELNKEIFDELSEKQLGLGGTDGLFNVLLEVSEKSLFNEKNPRISSELKNSAKEVPQNPLLFNRDIQKYLIVDLIPEEEFQFYTNIFFDKIHESYYIFPETKFKQRQMLFFESIWKNPKNNKFNFSNEEICSIYLVWILGRNFYVSNLLQVNNEKNKRSMKTLNVEKYINVINLCLSNCFFSKNLDTVRMLYLAGLYYSTIKNREAAWHILSNCCLKCISLGFHQKSVVRNFNESIQEEIKIAWWSSFRLHMNNCAIRGRLPNISLYEVDLDLPKLTDVTNSLFKDTYFKSVELFKIMFSILKNREYILKTKHPWSLDNIRNVVTIGNDLTNWEKSLNYLVYNYKSNQPKRYQIKLHLQFHYLFISLTVPYLLLITIKVKKTLQSDHLLVDTLCYGIKAAVEVMNVISFSVNCGFFSGLLYYDMFYAYNALMVLLLAFTLLKGKSTDIKSPNYSILLEKLYEKFNITIETILEVIQDIREINRIYGSNSVGTMKDASKNIYILLSYFKMNNEELYSWGSLNSNRNRDTTSKPNKSSRPDYSDRNPESFPILSPETRFFQTIDFMNAENDLSSMFNFGFNDNAVIDWTTFFGTDNCAFSPQF